MAKSMCATSSIGSASVAKLMSTPATKMQCYIFLSRLKHIYITEIGKEMMLLIDMIPANYEDASFRKFNHVLAFSALTPQFLIC